LTINLTKGATERLIEALKYWQEYMNNIKEIENAKGVHNLYKIYSRKGWFGAVVCDHLFSQNDRLFHKSPKNLAYASFRSLSGMDRYTNSLTGPRNGRLSILLESSRVLRGEIVPKR